MALIINGGTFKNIGTAVRAPSSTHVELNGGSYTDVGVVAHIYESEPFSALQLPKELLSHEIAQLMRELLHSQNQTVEQQHEIVKRSRLREIVSDAGKLAQDAEKIVQFVKTGLQTGLLAVSTFG
ncbi:hypothetical protein P3C22_15755 [Pseudomonas sp. ER28]|uniref:hypothetical protein n=1 Tax=Pseudomonas sp. ER28 TaxID=3033801 RepID=UPI0023E0342C|nr:hypothetical protein [Pseudomonas sp. ER28]MDF3173485.1 hypothetical protein [Pseudomonas sp. ER28]